MANLYTIPPGQPMAEIAAAHVLATVQRAELARAVLLLPTRRACVTMRQAFQQALAGRASLLPRMFPLADIDAELLTLLGPKALGVMETIPPAMPDWQQRYLLTAQVRAFETRRLGAVTLDHALALADELMTLQDQCARAGVTLTAAKLRQLAHADFATHWEQSLQFLAILSDYWPEVEHAHRLTTKATREVKVLEALSTAWQTSPPNFPVFAIGSTASQATTAALLQTIATMPAGHVILPGLDPDMPVDEWQTIAPGHPLYHLKQFLDRFPLTPANIPSLGPQTTRSVWLSALGASESIPNWHKQPLPAHTHLHLIPCTQPEEEARTITLLIREALEQESTRIALVTPDEGLMARVATHLKRYGIIADRLQSGTLATTQEGSLWDALTAAIAEPDRLLTLRSLLHHPLIKLDAELIHLIEPYWYGTATHRAGQLPRLPETVRQHHAMLPIQKLVRELAHLARSELTASHWIDRLTELLAPLVPQSGEGHTAVTEALDAMRTADILGPMAIDEFKALLAERLAQPWRDPGLMSHPRIFMLTPVEARLQQFDRIILANMQESIWPGLHNPSAWLNLAAQTALGLPVSEERISLMAHDILMLASSGDVFLTYPLRDQGSPATRSRFIERLVTLLATHHIPEQTITAHHYTAWAQALYAAEHFTPAKPVTPRPPSAERPRTLPVSTLDRLFTDPFSIYARHVLNLKPLREMDGEPEAVDFGSLAHKALQALTEHWNETHRPADATELTAIADSALANFSDRPNVALFWHRRLLRALHWVNQLEAEHRAENQTPVQTERAVQTKLELGGGESITLQGRIDRLEQTTLIDYKTGDAPTASKIRQGEALQLLAYAMLLEAEGEPTANIAYWSLPRGNHPGTITQVPLSELTAIPGQLREALTEMLNETTPFLARPIPTNTDQRFGNDYDGISRYDEWAG